MNDNSLIKDIGRSYIISSFLPAAFFTTIGAVLFRDFIPWFIQNSFFLVNAKILEQLFLLSLVSTWLGFLLYSGWFGVVRFYEGYFFMKIDPLYSWLMRRQELRYDKKFERVKRYQQLIKVKKLNDEEKEEKRKLDPIVQSEMESLQLSYPQDKRDLLPSRLGNVMRAYEEYSVSRYGISGITFWPRLYQLLPSDMRVQLEERNNQFIFLLNSSLLSALLGSVCLLVNLIRLPCQIMEPLIATIKVPLLTNYCSFVFGIGGNPTNFFQKGFASILPHEYFLIGLAFFVIAYVIYSLSIITAENIGLIVRTAFDLFRLDLLEKLNCKRPNSISEERQLWDPINEFVMVGDSLGSKPFDYNYVFSTDTKEDDQDMESIRVEGIIRPQKRIPKKKNKLPLRY